MNNLNTNNLNYKFAITIFVSIIYIFSYTFSQFLALNPTLPGMTGFELSIPFIPWTIIPYLSFYIYFVFGLCFLDMDLFHKSHLASFLGTFFSVIIFNIYPTSLPPRTMILESGGLLDSLFLFLYSVDATTNCFPSLHVSVTITISYYLLKQIKSYNSKLSAAVIIWAIMICLSTLTTKQHYLVDVIGGSFVSLFSILIVKRIFH